LYVGYLFNATIPQAIMNNITITVIEVIINELARVSQINAITKLKLSHN